MRTGQRGPMVWGLALSAVIHALLGLALLRALELPRPPQPHPGRVLTVALMAPAKPAAAAQGEAVPDSVAEPESVADEVPESAADPVREELHYYFPDELDRQLIVLRDRSGDAEIDLPAEVVMHLFIDVQGRVAAITFEGEEPAPALQEQLRAAFMTMEFMPGMKQGQPVPARIKIGIAPVPQTVRQIGQRP